MEITYDNGLKNGFLSSLRHDFPGQYGKVDGAQDKPAFNSWLWHLVTGDCGYVISLRVTLIPIFLGVY